MTEWTWNQVKEMAPGVPPKHEPVMTLLIGDLTGSESFNGATRLYAVAADQAVAEAIAPLAGRPIDIKISEHAYPGRIYGFNGRKAFLPCLRIDIQEVSK